MANPKVDLRQGTIEDDEDYKSFLALLERGENPSKEKILGQISTGTVSPQIIDGKILSHRRSLEARINAAS